MTMTMTLVRHVSQKFFGSFVAVAGEVRPGAASEYRKSGNIAGVAFRQNDGALRQLEGAGICRKAASEEGALPVWERVASVNDSDVHEVVHVTAPSGWGAVDIYILTREAAMRLLPCEAWMFAPAPPA